MFLFSKAGIPPLYFEAGRDGPFQTLVAGGAGVCAADSRRKNGVPSVGVRRPPHCTGKMRCRYSTVVARVTRTHAISCMRVIIFI